MRKVYTQRELLKANQDYTPGEKEKRKEKEKTKKDEDN